MCWRRRQLGPAGWYVFLLAYPSPTLARSAVVRLTSSGPHCVAFHSENAIAHASYSPGCLPIYLFPVTQIWILTSKRLGFGILIWWSMVGLWSKDDASQQCPGHKCMHWVILFEYPNTPHAPLSNCIHSTAVLDLTDPCKLETAYSPRTERWILTNMTWAAKVTTTKVPINLATFQPGALFTPSGRVTEQWLFLPRITVFIRYNGSFLYALPMRFHPCRLQTPSSRVDLGIPFHVRSTAQHSFDDLMLQACCMLLTGGTCTIHWPNTKFPVVNV